MNPSTNFRLSKIYTFLDKHFLNILKITLALEVFILLLASTKHIFSPDEIEFLRSGWFLSQGQKLYTGFFENHHPLYFYSIAPFFTWFSDPLKACIAIRLLTCGFFFLTMFGVFSICTLLYNCEIALLAASLTPAWFMTSRIVFETRSDIPQVTCAVWSIYFLIKTIQSKKIIYSLISGVLFGLAFLFLQKIALLAIPLVLILAIEVYLAPSSIWLFLSFSTGIVGTLAPYYMYLWQTNQLVRYWQLCYIFNTIDQGKSMYQTLSPIHFLRFIFAESVYRDRIIWACSALGLLTLKQLRPLFPILAGLFIGIFWGGIYYMNGPQYHILYAPFASVFAGIGLFHLRKKDILASIIFFYACLYPLHFHVCTLIFSKSTNQEQLKEAKYCAQFLQQNERVAAGNYHLLFYNDSHPIWYMYGGFNRGLKTYYERATNKTLYSWLEEIKRHRPIFIGKKVCYDDLEKTSFFKNTYVQSSVYPDLYIRRDKLETLKGTE